MNRGIPLLVQLIRWHVTVDQVLLYMLTTREQHMHVVEQTTTAHVHIACSVQCFPYSQIGNQAHRRSRGLGIQIIQYSVCVCVWWVLLHELSWLCVV